MKGKYNHFGLYILTGLLLGVSALGPKMITFAGDINSNEASVISAASGTFTYEGKTYQAGSAYINSLTSYLSGDDVDLNAQQADAAIAMMYDSIGDGIQSGYLYEVGGTGDTVIDTTQAGTSEQDSTTTEDTKSDKEDKDNQKDKADKNQKDKKGTTDQEDVTDGQSDGDGDSQEDDAHIMDDRDEDPMADGNLNVWEAMDNKTETKSKLEERPKKKDAEYSVHMDGNDIIITTKDNQEITLTKSKTLVSNKLVVLLNVIAGVLFALTVGCGIILFSTKCMLFKKRKSRRRRPGHSKRRVIRRYTRNVLTVTTGVSLIGIAALVAGYISLFNDDTMMKNMQNSGYFRYAYSEYIAEVEEGEEIESYEDYLFTIKQNSLKILNGETNVRIPDSNVAPYIHNLKLAYQEIFKIAGVLAIVNVVLGFILMVFMDQRRERGVKHIAFADLLAGVVLVAFMAVMTIKQPYAQFYIEPDYLYLFLLECVRWALKVMTSITAFSIVVGMLLIGVYKMMLNNYENGK